MNTKLLKTLILATVLALPAGEIYADSGSKTTPCYFIGKSLNIDSGCTLEVKSGGTLLEDSGSTVTSTSSSTWADGKNIILGTATGSKIGTATTQKLGFYNSTPIVQNGASVDIITGLQNLGLFASGTHSVNKVTLTAPATGSTLTIVDGKTLTVNNTMSFTGGDSTAMTFPNSADTVLTAAAANNITGSLQLNSLEIPMTPGGRLTLSSTVPVPTADITAAGTMYYLPYVNQLVPIWNGTHWLEFDIGTSGRNFVLGATNMPTTQVYDVYMVNVSGTPTLCSMYWGTNTARSSTVGGKTGGADARVVQKNGIWVNNAALSASDCFGGGAGTTGVAAGINQATLLGSYYTTGSAQTGIAFKPAGASGGSNNIIGLSNAYNRIPMTALNRETAASFTIASTTFATENASNADRITWVDTLQQSPVTARAMLVGGDATIGDCAAMGVVLDATSGTPNVVSQKCSSTSTIANEYGPINVIESFYPQMGLHFVQEEIAALIGGTSTFNPVATQNGLALDLQW
jgi:hypothetical protein